MNRRAFLYTTVAAVAAFGGYSYLGRSGPAGPDLMLGQANAQTAEVDTSRVTEMTLGNPEASVTVIEYASYTCPHCRAFHDGPFKQLKADYIDTGKIHFIYREVYFDRFGLWAAMIARCGGPERYFGIHDLIYDTQSEWTKGEPGAIADNLRKLGRTAGMSEEQVNGCLEDGAMAQALVAVYQKNAEADGVNSTPTFLINGTKYNNMPYDEFSAILEKELAG
jgi:protein-disulfide isomerase